MMQQNHRHGAAPIYFLFACAFYLVGSNYLGAEGLSYISMVSLGIALLVGLSAGDHARTGSMPLPFLIMAMVAAVNVLVSTDRSESMLRWVLWFEMFFALGLLATRHDESVVRSLVTLLPFGAVMIWYAKYTHAGSEDILPAEKASAMHLSAFFASVTIASGLFHPRVIWRVLFCVIGTYGVLFSGSRAGFIFYPLLFIAPGLYYFRSRAATLGALLLPLALLAAFFLNEDLRDMTFGRKAAVVSKDALLAAESSADDRGYLRGLAVDMILDRPLGYGYGNTYMIPGLAGKSRGTNFHNGYLNVGAAMGLPFLLVYVGFNVWLVWSLYSEERAPRLFRHLFLSILVCVNIRTVTEDFTLFDLGNPICYLVVYLSLIYLNKRRYAPIGFRE